MWWFAAQETLLSMLINAAEFFYGSSDTFSEFSGKWEVQNSSIYLKYKYFYTNVNVFISWINASLLIKSITLLLFFIILKLLNGSAECSAECINIHIF